MYLTITIQKVLGKFHVVLLKKSTGAPVQRTQSGVQTKSVNFQLQTTAVVTRRIA